MKGKRVKRFGILLAAVAGLLVAVSMSGVMNAGVDSATSDTSTAAQPASGPAPTQVAAVTKLEAPAAPAPASAAPQTVADSDKSALPDPELHKKSQDGKKLEGGKWVLEDGSPTYDVVRDEANTDIVKKVDWYTYSGWRRYHAECHVCHGPNAEGSTFAPALKDSLKTMDYPKFLQVVSSGQVRDVAGTKYIMPALGDNKNVMCYIDDLYVYLRARSTDALPGGRLSADQRAEKPKEAAEYEKSCLGD
jgi:methanol metabolism-related c-type cytochrome